MQIYKPSYYDTFRCIAQKCPDSCCKEWEVEVDDRAAAFYRNLPGPLGDRLREVLRDDPDWGTVMTIENHRCPMWRQDGLCRIQAELGHDALCKTCREFPRLRHDYGSFQELGLELACPEAARIILTAPDATLQQETAPGGDTPEYDEELMELLLRTRTEALAILMDPRYSPGQALSLLLYFGYHAQSLLMTGKPRIFSRTFLYPRRCGLPNPAVNRHCWTSLPDLKFWIPVGKAVCRALSPLLRGRMLFASLPGILWSGTICRRCRIMTLSAG